MKFLLSLLVATLVLVFGCKDDDNDTVNNSSTSYVLTLIREDNDYCYYFLRDNSNYVHFKRNKHSHRWEKCED